MRRTIDSAEKSLSSLMEQFTRAKEGWNFDEEAYFSGKGFFLEVLAAASEQGLSIFEQDERLYWVWLLFVEYFMRPSPRLMRCRKDARVLA